MSSRSGGGRVKRIREKTSSPYAACGDTLHQNMTAASVLVRVGISYSVTVIIRAVISECQMSVGKTARINGGQD